MQQQALTAMVAWMRLDTALKAFEASLKRDHKITALQLAVLHIVSERPHIPLAALRKALIAHPATLGQAIDDLRRKGLCQVRSNPEDRRARNVAITESGSELVAAVPLTGPMRLRDVEGEAERLVRLAPALGDAVELFGLAQWVGKQGR
ncbi:MarR family transcriptional regulator [Devosia sp. XJ19-1]|uniref:MarR family transcriptional regulator n=1 Tax=Devosia ureilytica TaxID=2952754 RepID=A0A9Q4AMM4_9HYPH|nr:MarR family transcriptional regulator [Devosia ureilytica]MCP8882925.1 MarR family transcriptional regulator [Devosia ureilytica]MCP8886707.1 MarR family transcriptional regulator [Devosia ureilytica]